MAMSEQTNSTLVPCLRYRNALAAIDWLVRAFGLVRHAVYMGEGDTVAHAELTSGGGMIMLGSAENASEYSKLMAMPDEIHRRNTQSVCLVVPDADAVYATAKAAGAEMVLDIRDMDYGGRGFTCRDPEGHVWSVGSYNPWQCIT